MKGASIGEFEELVLLAIAILYQDAYSLSIMSELENRTNRKIMISSIHKVLVRLEDKGFVKSYQSAPTAERGGRAKKLYELTKQGKSMLTLSKDLRNEMWTAIPKLTWSNNEG